MATFRLSALGPLRLEGPAGELLQGRRKELALLVYLARASPRPVRRETLADAFWGERGEARARQSLRQALLSLRRALGDAVVVVGPATVHIADGALVLDASELELRLQADDVDGSARLWQGEFLAAAEDVGSEPFRLWLESERVGLGKRMTLGLQRQVERDRARGAWQKAADWAQRWADLSPVDELANTHLVETLASAGRTDDAAAAHARFTTRVGEVLGEAPSANFEQIADELLSGAASVSLRQGVGSAALFSPTLVGRAAEMNALLEAWWAVSQGGSTTVSIEGEGGIGKTRLVEEFLREGIEPRSDAVVLSTRSLEIDRDNQWSSARVLFADLRHAPGLGGAADRDLAEVSHLVPSLRDRFSGLAEPTADPTVLSRAMAAVLECVADEGPIVLYIDDLPRADPESRDLVIGLAADPPPGLLIVVSGRPEELQAEGLAAALRAIPELRRLALQPLGLAETEVLVSSMVELPSAQRRRAAERLYEDTDGIPFYQVELVAALADAGHLALGPQGEWEISQEFLARGLPTPPGLRHATRDRLAGLSDPARRVIEAAAVMDRHLHPAVLQAATALRMADLSGAIDELIVRRLIRESPEREAGYEFTHEILRRGVHDLLSSAERDRLKRAVASPTTFAVFPFQVRGTEEHAYLADGMVDLLSAAMDGAGALRTVDVKSFLRFVHQDEMDEGDPERARSVAGHYGAGLYVLGVVVGAGDRLRISATLYDQQKVVATAHATAEGGNDVFDRVDELARGLLAGRFAGASRRMARLAATTTGSLPALKAYLEGEQLNRAGRFRDAYDAYALALEQDPRFALAAFRLARAAYWLDQDERAREAIDRALALAARLSPADRQLLRAFRAWYDGDADSAEQLYRDLTRSRPDDFEPWFGLGDVQYHHNQLRGRTSTESWQAFDQAWSIDRESVEVRLHLSSIAARQGDVVSHDEIVESMDVSADFAPFVNAVAAHVRNDSIGKEEALETFSRMPDRPVSVIVNYVATLPYDDVGAFQLAGLLIDPTRPPAARLRGHLSRAALALALGAWGTCQDELAAAQALDPVPALTFRAFWSLLSWLEVSEEARSAVCTDLLALIKGEIGTTGVAESHHLDPRIPRYLLGLHAAFNRRAREAKAIAEELESEARNTDFPPSYWFGASIQAQVLIQQEELTHALEGLEQCPIRVPSEHHWKSPFTLGAFERYTRAGLLARVGRETEAMGWYSGLGEDSHFGRPFSGMAHYHRGMLLEQSGQVQEAGGQYDRFLAVWHDADGPLQRIVQEARQRRSNLG